MNACGRSHSRALTDAEKVELTIGERVGEYAGKAEKRIWKVRVHGDQAPVVIRKQSETDEVILL